MILRAKYHPFGLFLLLKHEKKFRKKFKKQVNSNLPILVKRVNLSLSLINVFTLHIYKSYNTNKMSLILDNFNSEGTHDDCLGSISSSPFTLSSETSSRDESKNCTNSFSGLITSEDCENSITAKDNNTSIKGGEDREDHLKENQNR